MAGNINISDDHDGSSGSAYECPASSPTSSDDGSPVKKKRKTKTKIKAQKTKQERQSAIESRTEIERKRALIHGEIQD